jgi:glycosyltransferase involved in cell wall biosynthesis
VVVPAYQNRRFIARTLTSILEQTLSDFELIVADHASTDGTMAEVEPFLADSRLRTMTTSAGGGAERNWNNVTSQARGTYVKLVCGDDVIYPDSLAKQLHAFEQYPSAGIVAAKRDLIDPVDDLLVAGRGLGRMSGLVPGDTAVRTVVRAGANLLGEPACTLIRADLLRKVGGWSATYPYLIDQDTYMRVLAHADLVAVPEPLGAFRISDTQWSVQLASEQARQAAAVHRDVRARLPEAVSSWDARLGSLRALRMAWMRRAAYFAWRKRIGSTS